jgi:hypothetical protein
MDEIVIIDDFLNNNELSVTNELINTFLWKYGHTSGDYEIITNSFFSTFNLNDFFSKYILQKINHSFSKHFTINRNYMHIQTFGIDGSYHIDDTGENKYTFCLYLSTIPDTFFDKIGGDLYLKIPAIKHIVSVEPTNNRGVLFPSIYLHKGMAYNKDTPNIKRLCITWKLEEVLSTNYY